MTQESLNYCPKIAPIPGWHHHGGVGFGLSIGAPGYYGYYYPYPAYYPAYPAYSYGYPYYYDCGPSFSIGVGVH